MPTPPSTPTLGRPARTQSAIVLRAAVAFALLGAHIAAAQTYSELDALKAQLDALAEVVAQQALEIEQLKRGTTAAPEGSPPPATAVADADPQAQGRPARQPLGRFPDDAIVTAGNFDGAIRIPGTGASVRLGGFIRAEGNYDLDNAGFQDSFNPRTIPLDGSTSDDTQQVRFHVRNTRVNLDVRNDTALGEFRTFVEFDFFGGGNEFISN
ncbi:MAG: porin, partial [Pseudomonadota bacterium]